MVVEADINDPDSVQAMYEQIEEAFGKLDVLVLNASGGLEKDVDQGYAMTLNRDSQVALAKGALPLMGWGALSSS